MDLPQQPATNRVDLAPEELSRFQRRIPFFPAARATQVKKDFRGRIRLDECVRQCFPSAVRHFFGHHVVRCRGAPAGARGSAAVFLLRSVRSLPRSKECIQSPPVSRRNLTFQSPVEKSTLVRQWIGSRKDLVDFNGKLDAAFAMRTAIEDLQLGAELCGTKTQERAVPLADRHRIQVVGANLSVRRAQHCAGTVWSAACAHLSHRSRRAAGRRASGSRQFASPLGGHSH